MMGEKKKETLKKANRWGEKGLFGGAIQVCTYTKVLQICHPLSTFRSVQLVFHTKRMASGREIWENPP